MKPIVSVLIPSRNEIFLEKTVEEVLKKAEGEIEVIIILDGYWTPKPIAEKDPRVHVLHRGVGKGLRNGLNAAVDIARGDFVMKLDAHCMVDQGFDVKLARDCQPNWIMIPRRKRLDAENWCIQDVGKIDVDYELLSFPDDEGDWGGKGLHTKQWNERSRERLNMPEYDIDDDMSYQASCWFMPKDYYRYLELFDEANYVLYFNEAQEAGLKCWLSGGRVVVNKKTWFAHLKKGKKYPRGYMIDKRDLVRGNAFVNKWLTDSAGWAKQTLPFTSLIEKFWPVPGWPDDWKEQIKHI